MIALSVGIIIYSSWDTEAVVNSVLRFAIKQADLPVTALTIQSLGLNRVDISHLKTKDHLLQLDNIQIDYHWSSILQGEIDRVRVESAKLHLHIENGRLVLPWEQSTSTQSENSTPSPLPHKVVIDAISATVAVDHQSIAVTTPLHLTLTTEDKKQPQYHFTTAPNSKTGDTLQPLTISAPKLNIQQNHFENIACSLQIAGKIRLHPVETLVNSDILSCNLHSPTTGFLIDRLQSNITFQYDTESHKTDARIGTMDFQLNSPTSPSSNNTIPLSFSGTILQQDDMIELNGIISDRNHTIPITVSARHGLDDHSGTASIRIDSQHFSPNNTQPHILFPPLKGLVTDLSGDMGAIVELSWGNLSRSRVKLNINQMDMQTNLAEVKGLSTEITLDSIQPLLAKRPQQIHIDEINPGIPIQNFKSAITIQPETVIVDSMEWTLADSVMYTDRMVLPLHPKQLQFSVHADQIDLSDLSRLASINGLQASGTLHGTFPVTIQNDKVFVNHATLSATTAGVIQYQGHLNNASQLGGEPSNLLLQALENFHYNTFSLEANGELSGDFRLAIQLQGNNPDLYEGYPLNLNFTIEGDLFSLLKQHPHSMSLPQ